MKNVVLWGFDSHLVRNVMEELEEEGLYKIKRWVVSETQKKGEFFSKRNDAIAWFQEFLKGSMLKESKHVDFSIESKLYLKIYTLLDRLVRESYFTNNSIYENLNVLYLLIYNFNFVLKKEKIDLVIFEDIPHGAPDSILYYLCKELSIKTLILVPTKFSNHFNYIFDIEDYGIFDKSPIFEYESKKISIKKTYQKNLYYMNSSFFCKGWRERYRIFFDFKGWKKERKEIIQKNRSKYPSILNFLCKKISQYLIRYHRKTEYEKNIKEISVSEVDLMCPFVYFPLHLQPEMTTATLGGKYCDQLLAIERLRELLPDNWYIYVKENPKQTSYMRDKYFFDRLKLISNLCFVDRSVDTYQLIQTCKFVATITGTAGWEAISGGKNTVIFGYSWYKNFPGVFQYSENLKVEDVLEYKIDHERLNTITNLFMKKTAIGIYRDDLIASVENIKFEENEANLSRFLRFILKSINEHKC